MTPLVRAFAKAWGDAGSLADELPWWGWVDEHTCLTLPGGLLSLAELEPLPADGRSREELGRDVADWERLCGQLPPGGRMTLHALRRPLEASQGNGSGAFPAAAWAARERLLASRCGDLRLVLGWCLDGGLAQRAGLGGGAAALEALRRAADDLRGVVDGQLSLLGGRARLLGRAEGTAVLAELANRPGTPAPGPGAGGGLSWRLALSDIESHARHIEVGGEAVALLSLGELPPAARPNSLRSLAQKLGGAWTLSWEWRRISKDAARKKIRGVQRHYHSKRFGLMAHMRDTAGTDLAMEDVAATTEADRIGMALVEADADGVPYGELAVSLALHGSVEEVSRMASDAAAIFAAVDAKVSRETYGQMPQWFARLPGAQRQRQLRLCLSSAGAAACMAPLWGDRAGHAECRHLSGPPLALFETPGRSCYRYDLFHGTDVGHTLLLGATGSGKSFLLNFLLVNAQRYRPRVCVLDLGGSYKALTEMAGGGYLSLDVAAAAGGVGLQPFGLPDTPATRHFLAGWIEGLLATGGYHCTGDDAGEIRQRVEDIYGRAAARRRLGAFCELLPARMKPAMSRWVGGGAWGSVFDADPEAVARSADHPDWQVIDISGAARQPDLCAAALSYFLERMRTHIEDPGEASRLKLMVVDEAWRFLADQSVGAWLAEAAKTWRKRSAALILATQSAGDVLGAESAGTILESVPHRLYLANPDLPPAAAEVLGLTEAEIETVRRMRAKREIYLSTQGGSALLKLEVGKADYWLYTSSAAEVERRDEAVERLGSLEAAVRELSGEQAAA